MKPTASERRAARRWREGWEPIERDIARETAVAIVVNGSTQAVMMATPADLEDFGVGFLLSEGIIATAAEIERLEIVFQPLGAEVRVWIEGQRADALSMRRRAMAGPTGCGLCGIESLEAAMLRPVCLETDLVVPAGTIGAAMAALEAGQDLGRRTRAVHAAGFYGPDTGEIVVREDVGRHNALDKVAGALGRHGLSGAGGMVLLTSRVSVEMIQKTARIGAGIVVAVSAPTSLAVETAEEAGITLVGVARLDGFEVFTHPHRIV